MRRALKCRQSGGMQSRPCQQQQPVAVAEDEVHEGGIAEDLGKLSPLALSRLSTTLLLRAVLTMLPPLLSLPLKPCLSQSRSESRSPSPSPSPKPHQLRLSTWRSQPP